MIQLRTGWYNAVRNSIEPRRELKKSFSQRWCFNVTKKDSVIEKFVKKGKCGSKHNVQ